jgi:hypothetical protein
MASSESRHHSYDPSRTKAHVMAAGRELMLAAQGALRFCKDYAEKTASPATKPQLVKFFSRAIAVADEFSKGLVTASKLSKAAQRLTSPLFDALGRELKGSARPRKLSRKARGPRRVSGRRVQRRASHGSKS